jgi:hypothetical protein
MPLSSKILILGIWYGIRIARARVPPGVPPGQVPGHDAAA